LRLVRGLVRSVFHSFLFYGLLRFGLERGLSLDESGNGCG
jgi:hypothetical protein